MILRWHVGYDALISMVHFLSQNGCRLSGKCACVKQLTM